MTSWWWWIFHVLRSKNVFFGELKFLPVPVTERKQTLPPTELIGRKLNIKPRFSARRFERQKGKVVREWKTGPTQITRPAHEIADSRFLFYPDWAKNFTVNDFIDTRELYIFKVIIS